MKLDPKTIQPIAGKILAQALGGDYETDSGLYVVDSDPNAWPKKCLVVAVGGPFEDEKGKTQTYRAKPGQTVFIKKKAGQMLNLNRKKYLVLKNEEIVAVDGD